MAMLRQLESLLTVVFLLSTVSHCGDEWHWRCCLVARRFHMIVGVRQRHCAPLCVHTCTQVADEEYQSRVCDYVTLFFDSFFFLFLCFLRQQLFLGIGRSLISAKSLMAIRRRLIIISDRIEESWLFVILKCLIEKISIIIEIEVFDKE